jgi:cell division septation protein DedD
MEKYILNLLKENSRVIIPEFGAFIIRQQNPPEIAFNSLLTFNDGILTEYVSHNSGISFLEAQVKVADYVEKLNADLKIHNRLSFNEIGWVWLDESGDKQFTPWKSGDQVQTETQKPLRDLETILKEAEISEKSGLEVIPGSSGVQPEPVPFVLDDTIKEVDIDATGDNLLREPADDTSAKKDIPGESFSLEESPVSGPEIQNEPEPEPQQEQDTELIIKPKIDLSEPLQEFQQGKSITATETEAPKIGIRFKHEMPPEEEVIAKIQDEIPEQDKKVPSAEMKTAEVHHEEPKKPLEEVWHEIETKSESLQKSPKERKKHSWIVPVTIIGVLIIIAGAGWLFFPEQVTKIINHGKPSNVEIKPGVEIGDNTETTPAVTENQTEQESDQAEQESVQETAPVLNETETAIQQEAPVVSGESEPLVKKYYVVAGRFRSQQNAEKYTADLRTKGFNAGYFSTDDNLYTVSFSSFSSRESAEIEMNRIRKSIEPKAWILYY